MRRMFNTDWSIAGACHTGLRSPSIAFDRLRSPSPAFDRLLSLTFSRPLSRATPSLALSPSLTFSLLPSLSHLLSHLLSRPRSQGARAVLVHCQDPKRSIHVARPRPQQRLCRRGGRGGERSSRVAAPPPSLSLTFPRLSRYTFALPCSHLPSAFPLLQVREALWQHHRLIYGAYDYYSALYSENENALGEVQSTHAPPSSYHPVVATCLDSFSSYPLAWSLAHYGSRTYSISPSLLT